MNNTNIDIDNDDCKYESLGINKISEGLSIISGKWKLKILFIIGYNEVIRYGKLKKELTPITHKMLSNQLKELEKDGLIIRKEYPQVPPKVEYSLSEKGYGLIPMFDELYNWILKYNK